VKAVTHTESYRPFEGELRPGYLRFLPLASAAIRVGARRKLPLFVLYLPPAIATVIYSFVVHSRYIAISESMAGGSVRSRAIAAIASRLIEVRGEVVLFNTTIRIFALLAVAWYASGLLAEDRRYGAHRLYFSRPLTRLDYFLGKFSVGLFWGAMATVVPGLVICSVAAFSSPDWAFLRDDWDVVVYTILYGLLWSGAVTVIALAFSSLVDRRSWALAGIFGFFMLSQAGSEILAGIYDAENIRLLSLLSDFKVVGEWMFGLEQRWMDGHIGQAWASIGVICAAALSIVALRLRGLEAVG